MWTYFFDPVDLKEYVGIRVGSDVTYIKCEEVQKFKETLKFILEIGAPDKYETLLSPDGTKLINLASDPEIDLAQPILIYGFRAPEQKEGVLTWVSSRCARDMLNELRGNEADPEIYEKEIKLRARVQRIEREEGCKEVDYGYREPKVARIGPTVSENYKRDQQVRERDQVERGELDQRKRELYLKKRELDQKERELGAKEKEINLREAGLYRDPLWTWGHVSPSGSLGPDEKDKPPLEVSKQKRIASKGTITDLRDGKTYEIDSRRELWNEKTPEDYGIFSDGNTITARDKRQRMTIPFESARIDIEY